MQHLTVQAIATSFRLLRIIAAKQVQTLGNFRLLRIDDQCGTLVALFMADSLFPRWGVRPPYPQAARETGSGSVKDLDPLP